MTYALQKNWLVVTGCVVASFAPVMFLGSMQGATAPVQFTLDVVALPFDGLPVYGAPASRLLAAIMGGLLLGWAALIWGLRAWVFDLAPEGVRRSVVLSFVAWFVLDGAGSIASGHASNVLFNVPLLAAGIGPLWRPVQTPRTA